MRRDESKFQYSSPPFPQLLRNKYTVERRRAMSRDIVMPNLSNVKKKLFDFPAAEKHVEKIRPNSMAV